MNLTFKKIRWLSVVPRLLAGCVLVLLAPVTQGAQSSPPVPTTQPGRGYQFQFSLAQAQTTSAGIYNSEGNLVRTLWSLQPTAAGPQVRSWDGTDDLQRILPKGNYGFKMVMGVDASETGVIGNTGQPQTTAGHVPVNFESIATNRAGRIFTVHDWDEAHFDVIEWSPKTGQSIANSGHLIDGLVKAVAADDQAVYVSSYQNLSNPTKAKFYVYKLSVVGGVFTRCAFSVAGRAIKVYDGNVIYPADASPEDLAYMRMPLLSLAVGNQLLYVSDAVAGRVRVYDKVTGEERGQIEVTLPRSVAIAPDGNVWVAHDHHCISCFKPDGTEVGTPLKGASELVGITFGPHGELLVADRGANVVSQYKVQNDELQLVSTLGGPATPGDRVADRFYRLRGVATEPDGTVATIQNEFFFNGGRLAKFDTGGKPQWEQLGLEFQSNGTYASDAPDTFFSVMGHAYHLDRQQHVSAYLGNTMGEQSYRGPNVSGVPRIFNLGGRDFLALSTGDGIQIFAIALGGNGRGPTLTLASILGEAQPLPDGTSAPRPWERQNDYLWSWHDVTGEHRPTPETTIFSSTPASRRPFWQHGPISADADGNLWFVSHDRGGNTVERNAIYELPCKGLDLLGNPIYSWNSAIRVCGDSSGWLVQFQTAIHAAGGKTYAYGMTRTYPHAATDGLAWMGGNMLLAYEGSRQKWALPLKHVSVGLEVVPIDDVTHHDGVLIGAEMNKGGVYYYNGDGLLVSKMLPPPALGRRHNISTGSLDCFSAIAANRNNATGQLDVFVEDDFNDRILWYQVDDREAKVVEGPVEPKLSSATRD